jgi:hypothetical protein
VVGAHSSISQTHARHTRQIQDSWHRTVCVNAGTRKVVPCHHSWAEPCSQHTGSSVDKFAQTNLLMEASKHGVDVHEQLLRLLCLLTSCVVVC